MRPCVINQLVNALTGAERQLTEQRDCFYDCATNGRGEYCRDEDRVIVAEMDDLITECRVALRAAGITI